MHTTALPISSRFAPQVHLAPLDLDVDARVLNSCFHKGQHYHILVQKDILVLPYCHNKSVKFSIQRHHFNFHQQSNLYYVPAGEYVFHVSDYEAAFTFSVFSPHYFENHVHVDKYLQKMNSRKFGKLLTNNIHWAAKTKGILNELSNPAFPTPIAPLCIYHKTKELLIEVLLPEIEDIPEQHIKASEASKMELIHRIIQERMHENLTIQSLAREVGTNQQYVKKHFKLLYGHTIHAYLLQCRMTRAKELLLEKRHKISDIAERIGYKHATHFTSAFKKYYGYKPNVLK